MYVHIGRGLHVSSYVYNNNLWLSGLLGLVFLMAIAFLGYVLTWGQMSFWGGTVITNLLCSVLDLLEWMYGGFYVSNPTLKRFFVFHFLGPVILCALAIIHLYFLHYASSSHPWGYNTYNLSTFLTLVLGKDQFGLVLGGLAGTTQHMQNQLSLCHSDNSLEVNGLVIPLHIVPEWYFLGSYAILKAIPAKVKGS